MNSGEFDQQPAGLPSGGGDPDNGDKEKMPNEPQHKDVPFKTFIHDLRNKLAPIRNAAQLIRLRGAADATLLPIADMIDRQITGISGMLENFVEAERIKPGLSPNSRPNLHKPRRILIADDNDALRVSLSSILEEMGHEVKVVGDGEAAITMARSWAPGCVLLDIHMPKLDGVEAARQLRSQFPASAMKLIMMSGDTLNEQTVRAAKLAGFDHCLDKIGDLGLLQQILEEDT